MKTKREVIEKQQIFTKPLRNKLDSNKSIPKFKCDSYLWGKKDI